MIDFIKSIFTTPVNLWTLPQELFVMFSSIVIILFGCGIAYIAAVIIEKVKKRKNRK